MKETPPPILSSYLLREAEKFFPYPNKNRRTHGWIAFQKKADDKIRELAEWRKTFTPLPNGDLFDAFAFLLDELYCRDVLKKIPEFVERTRRLSNLTLAGIPDRDSLAYLIESANCYIGGSTLAAVVPARSAPASPCTCRMHAPKPEDWLLYRGNYQGWGYSPLD